MSLDHILLGLLRDPGCGYELKGRFEDTATHFWDARLSQIYPTLRRMEERGWLRSRREPSERGPERKVYELASEGREELERWLRSGPDLSTERHAHVAQLFFMGELGDPRAMLDFLEELRSRFASRLEALEAIEAEWSAGDPRYPDDLPVEDLGLLAALQLGLAKQGARVRACEEMIRRLESRLEAGGGATADESTGRPQSGAPTAGGAG